MSSHSRLMRNQVLAANVAHVMRTNVGERSGSVRLRACCNRNCCKRQRWNRRGSFAWREISSEELTRFYLDRIERLNPKLNAFVSVFDRRAVLDARRKDLERRFARGSLPPFHGVPIGIKDLNLVRFSTAHFGSNALKLWSPVDDPTVTQLRKGGFVMMGKLASSELGSMPVTEPDTHPPTRNPWNLGFTPGGSSGGSAAAVAAGMLPIAHGSDGAGSVRIPASFCHLYGLKPSRGRLRNQFWMNERNLIYTCGSLARTVEDAAAMLDVMAGVTVGTPHRLSLPPKPFQQMANIAPPRLKIRMVVNGPICDTHPEIAAAVLRTAKALEEMGHHVEPADAPSGSLEDFLPVFQKMVSFTPGLNWSNTQPVTRWLAEAGKKLPNAGVNARMSDLIARLDPEFTGADAWLMPTVPVLPPAIGAWKHLAPPEHFRAAADLGGFTAVFNLLGFPAASIPAGLSSDGRPIGIQIACRAGEEVRVLALSRQLEQAMPWKDRRAEI